MSERPWPVVVLTALGAWLAAVPLFVVAAMWLGSAMQEPVAALVLGVVLLAGSVVVLRSREASLFGEQLAVPVMLGALALVAWGLIKPLEWRGTAGALCLITLGLGMVLPQSWMRVLLGVAAAQLALVAWSTETLWMRDASGLTPWVALHGLVVIWLGSLRWGQSKALSDIGTGWVVSTLLALASWSGMTFMLGQQLGHGDLHPLGPLSSWWLSVGGGDLGSAVLALSAGVWLARRWPWLRQPWCVGLGLVLATLSAFMPALGGVLLVAAACLVNDRRHLVVFAMVMAVWVLGAFYYQLAWPLATKAGVLVAAGLVLAVLAAWGGWQTQAAPADVHAGLPVPESRDLRDAWPLGLCALAVLLVANGAIWQKETLIRDGRAVFVALAPVDPRSLMQGDYMALRFVTDDVIRRHDLAGREDAPVRLVFKHNGQGVATPHRLHQGEALAPDELVIQMVHKHGRWLLVTDAFYFKEGEGARWAAARYGEFRVDAGGKALLVGLRGDKLAPL